MGDASLLEVDIIYIPSIGTAIPGIATVTAFKLSICVQGEEVLDLPLGRIDRLEKVGGASTKGETAYGIDVICKDYTRFRLAHSRKGDLHSRRPMYEVLRTYAFPLSNGKSLFAFEKTGLAKGTRGWDLYNFTREMMRQGVPNAGWRLSTANAEYELCPTYPAELAVPATLSDATVAAGAKFRSKSRLPALSWYNRTNGASISRCSQPRVGMTGKRCTEDETVLEAIGTKVGGGIVSLHIVDARPKKNAVANQAKGLGYEYGSNYPFADITFLNIENIHVMRGSFTKLRELCATMHSEARWFASLDATQWLRHVKFVLSGALSIVSSVERGKSVLVHCSDGWDRTAQLSSLAMLMLDPYYRTIEGFGVLVEKEWLAFGHKFGQRLGLGYDNHGDSQRSPVFLQFVDCVWQIHRQFPTEFEFSPLMLIVVLDEMYSCRFGTFLYNCEAERKHAGLKSKTASLWDMILADTSRFQNPLYSKMPVGSVIKCNPSLRSLAVWGDYFLRDSRRSTVTLEQRAAELKELERLLESECAGFV